MQERDECSCGSEDAQTPVDPSKRKLDDICADPASNANRFVMLSLVQSNHPAMSLRSDVPPLTISEDTESPATSDSDVSMHFDPINLIESRPEEQTDDNVFARLPSAPENPKSCNDPSSTSSQLSSLPDDSGSPDVFTQKLTLGEIKPRAFPTSPFECFPEKRMNFSSFFLEDCEGEHKVEESKPSPTFRDIESLSDERNTETYRFEAYDRTRCEVWRQVDFELCRNVEDLCNSGSEIDEATFSIHKPTATPRTYRFQ